MKQLRKKLDWWIIFALFPLLFFSLSTMKSFAENASHDFFAKQIFWIGLSFLIFFFILNLDLSFLKKSKNVLFLYLAGLISLLALRFFGFVSHGAKSWFSFGFFSFQPSDLMKFALILILAKYLARRHIEIKAFKHVFITGIYFFIPFLLIFLQPDFGSAIILLAIWFAMIMLSGLSKKHLFLLIFLALSSFSLLWLFVFHDYQKARILNFIHPLSDIQGAGYNAYQSTIAVGSGKLLGKGVGYGTQSRLAFLPEYQTDFIFAAIAEEWGFVGSVIVLFTLFFIVARILILSFNLKSNFERFFAIGFAFYLLSHIVINIGMNIGLMPVTGVTLPFLSYGGSHLVVEFIALAIFMNLRERSSYVYKEQSADAFFERV